MSAGVMDVEIALAPRSVGGRCLRRESGGDSTVVHGIDVVDPEHDPAPVTCGARGVRVELKVQVANAGAEAGK
jgi:hypothetical protein